MGAENLSTPVLFMIFNRLDTARRVFDAIRQAKPLRLYIAADGARDHKPGEDLKVQAVRDHVMSGIDWKCEVRTLFRDKNLGCKYAVSGAITWFFENEERGIILEDDTVPSSSFFGYCEELLERYKDDTRIWHISGATVRKSSVKPAYTYHFSIYPGIWGWASWADRWKQYDVELGSFQKTDFIKDVVMRPSSVDYWTKMFRKMKKNEINTWDFQWVFTIWSRRGLAVTPNINQVSNIGFDKDSTHTADADSVLANLEVQNIKEIIHPQNVIADHEQDEFLSSMYFSTRPLWVRVLRKIKGVLHAQHD